MPETASTHPPPVDAHDVFISYASKDQQRVEAFVRSLQAQGVRTWFDIDDLEHGDVLTKKIDQALQASRAVLLMLSQDSIGRAWVGWETETAIYLAVNNGKHLVPVLLEQIDTKGLPGAVTARKMLHLPPNDDASYKRAVSSLATILMRWRKVQRPELTAEEVHSGYKRTEPARTVPADTIRMERKAYWGHKERINCCAVTNDGTKIVTASDDRTLSVWDWETKRQLRSLQGHAGLVLCCAVSPDGKLALSGSHDKTLRVWDLESGLELRTLARHTGTIWGCAFAPDGRSVVSTSYDQTVRVWDVATGREQQRMTGHTGAVFACSVSPDGRELVSVSRDGTIAIWELSSGRKQRSIPAGQGSLLACAISPDGKRIVTAGSDGTLGVWDYASGSQWLRLRGHEAEVRSCSVSRDSSVVASASEDKTIRLWNLNTGECLGSVRRSYPVFTVSLSEFLVAGDMAGRLWRIDHRIRIARGSLFQG